MNIFNIAVYFCSGTICLSLALLLLFVRGIVVEDLSYKKIKNNLAYSALIDVFVDILALCLLLQCQDLFILDSFVTPTCYIIQLFLITKALLGLIHYNPKIRIRNYWYVIPFIILVAAYIIGYCIFQVDSKPDFLSTYNLYKETTYSIVVCNVLYTILFICFARALYIVITETLHYIKKLNNYYSGEEVIKGKYLSYIAFSFFGYFILAPLDFILSSEVLEPYFMIVNTIIFYCFVIFILNLKPIFASTKQLDHFDISKQDNTVGIESPNDYLNNIGNTESASSFNKKKEENDILDSIHQLEKNPNKPYLQDGILIADVANILGITDVQLSFILNHWLKINFNSWINTLRINESKNIMQRNAQLNISQVALSSGFKDTASFSKAFKKVTGVTPSEYKKKLNN